MVNDGGLTMSSGVSERNSTLTNNGSLPSHNLWNRYSQVHSVIDEIFDIIASSVVDSVSIHC